MTALEREQALGKKWLDAVHPEDQERIRSHFSSLNEQAGPFTLEYRFLRKDGSVLWVQSHAEPLLDVKGRFIGYLAGMQDIGAVRMSEAQWRAAHDAAVKATEMKSQFLANISHELRTPMNGVIGMTSLLQLTKLTAEQREYLTTIRTSGQAMLAIISELLDFSKIEAGKVGLEQIQFALRPAIDDCIDLFAEASQRNNLILSSIVSPEVPQMLFGDPLRLRQVLSNLLGNAIKFTQSGEVCLSVDYEDKAQPMLRFRVQDTGIGLSDEQLSRIFKPFAQGDSTTNRKFGGTGLGLSISKHLIEAMGGEIGAQSKHGEGSVFWFTLPVEAKASVPQPNVERKSIRVSTFSDNKHLANRIRQMTTFWGLGPVNAFNLDRLRSIEPNSENLVVVDLTALTGNAPAWICEVLRKIPRCLVVTSNNPKAKLDGIGDVTILKLPLRQSHLYSKLDSIINGGTPSTTGLSLISKTPPKAAIEGNILVAEDNLINQRLVSLMLAKLGYQSDTVSNGVEAVKSAETVPYAAILMDCQMPEMDGFEAARRIRKVLGYAKTPIIALTANVLDGNEQKCLDAGMSAFIPKPIEIGVLAEALSKHLSSSTPTPSAPTIDWSTIREIETLQEFSQDNLLNEIVECFVSITPPLLQELKAAIESKDYRGVQRLSHKIRGSSSHFGAAHLVQLCQKIEQDCRAARIEDFRAIETEFGKVQQELLSYLRRAA